MDWSYVAGFIDGEGTITFARTRTNAGNPTLKPRLLIGQKKPNVLYMIQEKIGTGHMLQNKTGLYVYQLDSLCNMPQVMELLIPYLIIKKRQAEIVVDYCKCKTASLGRNRGLDEHCQGLDIEMRGLNQRG
jgi:hypothetical protein